MAEPLSNNDPYVKTIVKHKLEKIYPQLTFFPSQYRIPKSVQYGNNFGSIRLICENNSMGRDKAGVPLRHNILEQSFRTALAALVRALLSLYF